MKIDELVKQSGDAELISLKISGLKSVLALQLDDGKEVSLEIETDCLSFFDVSKSRNPLISKCHIELLKISDFLSVQNNVYLPAASFDSLMKETKRGLNLAYGRSIKDYEWLFVIKGYEKLFVCLLKNMNSIRVQEA